MAKRTKQDFYTTLVKNAIIDELVATPWQQLAFSLESLRRDLEVRPPHRHLLWVVSGALEVERRAVGYKREVTNEQQLRAPHAATIDLFDYPMKDGANYMALTDREAVTICPRCAGAGRLTQQCKRCDGTGTRECTDCDGKGYKKSPCSNCRGRGRSREGSTTRCGDCNGYGFSLTECPTCQGAGTKPCPRCDNGDTTHVCDICQGNGRILQHAVLQRDSATVPVVARSIFDDDPDDRLLDVARSIFDDDPDDRFLDVAIRAATHVYISPWRSPDELRRQSSRPPAGVPPEAWRGAVAIMLQECAKVLSATDRAETQQVQVHNVQMSICVGGIIAAVFNYKDDYSGDVRIVLGADQEPSHTDVRPFPLSPSSMAMELIVITLSVIVGAAFSWTFESIFPFLSIAPLGFLLVLALRHLEWQKELVSWSVRGIFSLVILFGVVGILTVLTQNLTSNTMVDAPTILAIIALAVMTSFAILGIIKSEQATEFFSAFVKALFNK
jgi:hypothetical protein